MTYSSSLAVGRHQRFASKNQNTTTFRGREKAIGPVSNTIILIVMACLLGLLYLTQVTKTNAFSYRLNDLRKQQTSLQSERDQLEVDSARLQSLARIKDSQVTKNLVSVAPSATLQ
jgi:hypothetical protein